MNNLDKILQYLTTVMVKPVVVDDEEIFKPIEHIKLSSSFFLKDGCASCGCCCVPESNLYTDTEFIHIMDITKEEVEEYGLDFTYIEKLKSGLNVEPHFINGELKNVYIYNLDKNNLYLPNKGKIVPRCSWVFEKSPGFFLCHIHPVRSITCIMPHLRMMYNTKSKTTSIGNIQFGRNWAVKCPVTFNQPKNESEFNEIKKSRLDKLSHLNVVADDLGIQTYLPEIIAYVESIPFDNYLDYLGKDILNLPTVYKSIRLF